MLCHIATYRERVREERKGANAILCCIFMMQPCEQNYFEQFQRVAKEAVRNRATTCARVTSELNVSKRLQWSFRRLDSQRSPSGHGSVKVWENDFIFDGNR
jgi:hypothetical protein